MARALMPKGIKVALQRNNGIKGTDGVWYNVSKYADDPSVADLSVYKRGDSLVVMVDDDDYVREIRREGGGNPPPPGSREVREEISGIAAKNREAAIWDRRVAALQITVQALTGGGGGIPTTVAEVLEQAARIEQWICRPAHDKDE